METYLWRINKEKLNKTNLTLYSNFIKRNYKIDSGDDFNKLWKWSVNYPKIFWKSIWKFTKVKGDLGNTILQESDVFFKNRFFPDTKLNYAENLLRKNNEETAIIFKSENGYKNNLSWKNLNLNVAQISSWMKEGGVKKGDRVAAYLPNIPETVIAYISTAVLGAIWSSCSPDFGTAGVIDRFSQISPKILFIGDKYFYNGKKINVLERLPEILNKIPSIDKVVVVAYPGTEIEENKNIEIKKYNWEELINKKNKNKIEYVLSNFNDPLAILYSSGTTGKPKCICHGTGGVLLQHNKELQIHSDVKDNDRVFYFTTCGWMMWNWLVGALSSGATILLFDGFPMYKKDDLLFELASEEKVTLFGISAKYIDALNNNGVIPKNNHNLSELKTICSTGSPLSKDGFRYIYNKIKKDVHLSSISGGTDIVSCFVLGNLFQPVYAGEILVKGENVMLGYWNRKEDTEKVIKDGWLYTGDIGEIDPKDGYLKITDRKKDIIVSAGGDNISPAKIENQLSNSPAIDQAMVYGDGKNYLVAIIVPSKEFINQKDKINEIVNKINNNLTLVEKIKKFHLVNENFSIENGLLTPTMKVKRNKVITQYKNILENFYKK